MSIYIVHLQSLCLQFQLSCFCFNIKLAIPWCPQTLFLPTFVQQYLILRSTFFATNIPSSPLSKHPFHHFQFWKLSTVDASDCFQDTLKFYLNIEGHHHGATQVASKCHNSQLKCLLNAIFFLPLYFSYYFIALVNPCQLYKKSTKGKMKIGIIFKTKHFRYNCNRMRQSCRLM